ncbi:MAG: hypothetical protein ACLRRK_00790 [Parasutterella sp.]
MITKPISIPINLLGPGSQPERSVANTIGVPDIVDTFRQPYTPEVADKETAEKCRQFFIDLYEKCAFGIWTAAMPVLPLR